ncbi:MAG: CARDB domain-containing protein, partial [Planctomycetota bacterium]
FDPHLLEVVVDPDDLQPDELSEHNNAASCPLPYELHPVAIALCPPWGPRMFEKCSPCTGDANEIHGRVINTGAFHLYTPVTVIFEDHFFAPPVILGTAWVVNLRDHGPCDYLGARGATISHAFQDAGIHDVAFVVDPEATIPEYDETNNTFWGSIEVLVCTDPESGDPLPDLYVYSQHINPMDLNPDPGTVLDYVDITIFNAGPGNALGVVGVMRIDGQQLGDILAFGDIAAGWYRSLRCAEPWTVPEGPPYLHVYQMTIDPDDAINEVREFNNSATRSIIAGAAPDLFVDEHSIWLSDWDPEPGTTVTLGVLVKNRGGEAGYGTVVITYLNLFGLERPIAELPVYVPPVGADDGSAWVETLWEVPDDEANLPDRVLLGRPRAKILVEIIDVTPEEFDETNNRTERFFPGPRQAGKTKAERMR